MFADQIIAGPAKQDWAQIVRIKFGDLGDVFLLLGRLLAKAGQLSLGEKHARPHGRTLILLARAEQRVELRARILRGGGCRASGCLFRHRLFLLYAELRHLGQKQLHCLAARIANVLLDRLGRDLFRFIKFPLV